MIVGGSSALLVILGKVLILHYSDFSMLDQLQSDPIRILEAIIVGISFIGAGTILKVEGKAQVRYLTTAATLLFSGGIGAAVALSQFYIAAGAALLILFINLILGYLEFRTDKKLKARKHPAKFTNPEKPAL
jgi:putative Mg2+ transporter-C (MgtC) family protein